MTYKPSDTYTTQVTTQRADTGHVTDADSLPTALATRNGVDDANFSLTVTPMATGRYKVSGTIPATYAAGDQIQIIVSATVNAVAGTAVVDAFVIDAKRLADLNDFDSAVETVTVNHATPALLSEFFTLDSGSTFANAISGSVVKEIVSNVSGSGGGWTATEQSQIRTRLGLDGTQATPSATGDLTDIKDILQAATRK